MIWPKIFALDKIFSTHHTFSWEENYDMIEGRLKTLSYYDALVLVPLYTIHLASIEKSPRPPLTMDKEKYKNAYFQVTRGDYAPLLSLVNENMQKAIGMLCY